MRDMSVVVSVSVIGLSLKLTDFIDSLGVGRSVIGPLVVGRSVTGSLGVSRSVIGPLVIGKSVIGSLGVGRSTIGSSTELAHFIGSFVVWYGASSLATMYLTISLTLSARASISSWVSEVGLSISEMCNNFYTGSCLLSVCFVTE